MKNKQGKLPVWKRTFEFFRRLGNAENFTFGKIAKFCGKETETAEAWGRAPESDEHPTGTGKRNPSDMQIRLLGMAYEDNPGFAREWADIFPAYIDYLDEINGIRYVRNGGCALELLGQSAKEHADIIMEMLHNREPDLSKVWTEYAEFESVMNKFGACLKEEMKGEIGKDIGLPVTNGAKV